MALIDFFGWCDMFFYQVVNIYVLASNYLSPLNEIEID